MRSCGPERVPKHDRVLVVPNNDETKHSVRGLFVCVLSVFSAHVSSSSYQEDPHVPSFHT
jgi:hypothetical protein